MKQGLESQQAYFRTGQTRSLDFRRKQLSALSCSITRHTDKLLEALAADLGKPCQEAYAAEVGFVLRDIRHAIRKLPLWMKSRRVRSPLMLWPAHSRVYRDPLGVVLIIGPWNYPLQLLFSPLVAAIAGGNCICLKPSEFAPETARMIAQLCHESFPPEYIRVVSGAADTAAELVSLPFNHIFFTGSAHVAKKIMYAASANLTPLTLELGGKSPCVVCEDADIRLAARRIMWGKCLNAGQTCVAPDYVLAHRSIHARLLQALKAAADEFVPALETAGSVEYTRIINLKNFHRLKELLKEVRLYSGGESDEARLLLRPALVSDVSMDGALMREEIFGPVLPVLLFDSFESAMTVIQTHPSPLAAYLFSRSRSKMRKFIRAVPAGGMAINDTISHILPAELPFGGAGESGFGRYRGRAGFETFTQAKSVLNRGTFADPPFRYPPPRIRLEWLKRIYPLLMR